ncbi:tetratricopeptide repeat protein [Brevibacillus dissolubilis]|uniref:tetratricopeptide repeat protein n=1 Tax=Brevibacillus dissolubilis TaxID=1844116 RepID=UPI001115E767|nr:tetratricopeptide repeat protein [Brevibacillus dissolubilis]
MIRRRKRTASNSSKKKQASKKSKQPQLSVTPDAKIKSTTKAESQSKAGGKRKRGLGLGRRSRLASKIREVLLDSSPTQSQSQSEPAGLARGSGSAQRFYEEAVKIHQQAVDGDRDAVQKALGMFEQLHRKSPNNNLIKAYLGSSIAMLGRDESNPIERFQKAIKGLKLLDEAVAGSPDDVTIRMMRGHVSYYLPENYFHRTNTAIEDFSYLASLYETDGSAFSREAYWKLLYDLGHSYKRINRGQDAENTWEKLLAVAGDDKYSRLINRERQNAAMAAKEAEERAARKAEQADRSPNASSQANSTSKAPDIKIDLPGEGLAEQIIDYIDVVVPKDALKLYHRALGGDRNAMNEAADLFSRLSEAEPRGLMYKAYQSDLESMLGSTANNTFEMFGKGIKAMKDLDNLVNAQPHNIELRLIRGNQSYRLPESFFHRSATAIEDFEYLTQRYQENPSILSKDTYWDVLYKLGESYERLHMNEEAEATWKKLKSQNPSNEIKLRLMTKFENLRDLVSGHLSMDNLDEAMSRGKMLHDMAVKGNRQATKLSFELWERAFRAYPDSTVAEAYYGSSMALKGRDAQDPQEMFGMAFRGLKHVNNAVALDPDNWELRVLRGYFYYSLPPAFFHVTEKAIKDFEYLKNAYEENHNLYDTSLYHQILMDLGFCYDRSYNKDRAQQLWRKLIQETSDPSFKQQLYARGINVE